ncbi:SURP and G-patch domain-containing protein 1-like [Saccoglossus kowalevskii]|uniref:SURP and G-patch domain-containing protein 1-like n=1 Tax=Saccoglossus kowalevskii TaxID=10224 RepID=A0ABM0M3K9_SACKO|nr:PREDICTED: SURP and G-patch domain-containing protein 1-like [Saccoglossus kowalevskii]
MSYRGSSNQSSFGSGQPYKSTMMTDQERLILERKWEIERKLAEQSAIEEKEKAKAKKTEIKFQIKAPSSSQPKPEPKESANHNIFSNDGSFLAQFKKMQQGMQQSDKGKDVSSGSSTKSKAATATKPIIIGKKIGGMKLELKKTPPNISTKTSLSRADVFEDPDQNESNVSPPEDPETKQVVEQLAKFVAEGGNEVEEIAIERNKDNPAFWFLYKHNSNEYKYYKHLLKQLQKNSNPHEVDNSCTKNAGKDVVEKEGGKRKRKNRWLSEEPDYVSVEKIAATMDVNPAGLKGTSVLSAEQQKQLLEQQEMQKMYQAILSKRQGSTAGSSHSVKKHGGKRRNKYEYDSDEDTEGGTWEHKKRAEEMNMTQEEAFRQTSVNKGKHFIGDFLPPEELERFMEHVKSLKEGKIPDWSDYKEFKLKEDNIGYQMLQKAGWKEGEGLGSEGQGRKDPVNKGKTTMDTAGLGTEKPGDLQAEDDEFEMFRKRMMLAYRFRPNPLNNPRRPYY